MRCLRTFTFSTLSLGLLVLQSTMTVYGTDHKKLEKVNRPSEYRFKINIPEIIQEDLIERKVKFASKVYPGINTKLLQRDFQEYFNAGNCDVRVYEAPGTSLIIPNGSQKVGSGSSLTSWGNDGVRAKEPPIGVELPERTNPIDMEEAKKIANGVLCRLIPNAKERLNYEMVESCKSSMEDLYFFRWEYKWSENLEGSGRRARVWIREKDGFVLGAGVSAPLEEPAIPFEVILEEAREKVHDVRRKDIRLTEIHHFADRRLVWEHADDKGTYIKDHCIWDAMTGELLYSQVLNGGTYDKPYMNPDFYSYPTEEEVKAMVDDLIEKRARELEEKQGK